MLGADISKDWARLENGLWAPQGVLPSPGLGTVITCNDPAWGVAVQNTALGNTGVVDRELQRVQQHPLSGSMASSPSAVPGPREGTCPPLVTVFKSPAEALCPGLGSLVQSLHKSSGGTPTSRLWSRAGAQDAREKRRQRRHFPAGKSELLHWEVPHGKRGANRLKSAQEVLSVGEENVFGHDRGQTLDGNQEKLLDL